MFEQFSIPAFDDGEDPERCLGSSMASGKTPLPQRPVMLLSKLNPGTPRVCAPMPSAFGVAVCSPEFLVLEPARDVPFGWLESSVRYDERFYADIMAGVTGTTGSRQRIKPADALRATVPVVHAATRESWAAFAQPLITREAALAAERRTLTAIRDALLPKLVSGQIRIPLSNDPEEALGAAVEALDATPA